MRAETLSVYLCPFYVLTPFRSPSFGSIDVAGYAEAIAQDRAFIDSANGN